MKALLATTALVALTAMPVLAQTPATPQTTTTTQTAVPGTAMNDTRMVWTGSPDTFLADNARGEMRASTLIGKRVYVSEADVDETAMINDVGADWEDLGEISDVLITRGGTLGGILVDVGGFLGIGERTVAVEMDDLRMINDGDSAGDYFVVFTANRAALEGAPEYNETNVGWQYDNRAAMTDRTAAVAPGAVGTPNAAVVPNAGGKPMAMDRTAADNRAVVPPAGTVAAPRTDLADRTNWARTEGYVDVDAAVLTAEDLDDADVYDANNERIGEVSKLIIGQDGKITQAVIDVGGFLGMGEKPVLMNYSDLLIEGRADNTDLRVRVGATKEQLEAMPTYND
jgi:hypothetical protein